MPQNSSQPIDILTSQTKKHILMAISNINKIVNRGGIYMDEKRDSKTDYGLSVLIFIGVVALIILCFIIAERIYQNYGWLTLSGIVAIVFLVIELIKRRYHDKKKITISEQETELIWERKKTIIWLIVSIGSFFIWHDWYATIVISWVTFGGF